MLSNLLNRIRRRPVVYDGNFFQEAWFREWAVLGNVLAALIESEPRWRTILDFGCGPGVMIDTMTERGLDYIGCDYSVEARKLYLNNYGKHPERYFSSLDDAVAKKSDLLLSFDVLEHMRDDEVVKLLEKTAPIPEALFNISRSRGIPGHVNLKSDRAWISFMKKSGMRFEEERTVALRRLYAQLRPGSPDHWDRNLFLFSRM